MKINFETEPREFIVLLGLNGIGKMAPAFRCITKEFLPLILFIITTTVHTLISRVNNFNEVNTIIFGYCPKFDIVFEKMGVKENLEFYAKVKWAKTCLGKEF